MTKGQPRGGPRYAAGRMERRARFRLYGKNAGREGLSLDELMAMLYRVLRKHPAAMVAVEEEFLAMSKNGIE